MALKMLVALLILSSWNVPPAYTPKLNFPLAIGWTSTKHDVTTSTIDTTGTAVATPSTSFALSVPLLSAEAMMPRDMRGFWSRALHPEALPHSRFVRCDPPPLACIFYYCVICAAAFYMVALSPNDKTMRSRLGLALVLVLVGLPTAAAAQGTPREMARDDETSFDAAPPPLMPDETVVVGRMTDVLANGSNRQSFLLFVPRPNGGGTYDWLTKAGMRGDPHLSAILTAYAQGGGNVNNDPSGNGYVTAILAARGPAQGGSRQYKVRWTVDPQVPARHAEEWMLQRAMVAPGAQAMAANYDWRDDPDDANSEDEGGAPGGGGGPDSEPSQGGTAPP